MVTRKEKTSFLVTIFLLRLPVTQKALQLTLFSSLSSPPQEIWTDWRIKLDKCDLIRTHWRKV